MKINLTNQEKYIKKQKYGKTKEKENSPVKIRTHGRFESNATVRANKEQSSFGPEIN